MSSMFIDCPYCGFLVATDDAGRPLTRCPNCAQRLREDDADGDAPVVAIEDGQTAPENRGSERSATEVPLAEAAATPPSVATPAPALLSVVASPESAMVATVSSSSDTQPTEATDAAQANTDAIVADQPATVPIAAEAPPATIDTEDDVIAGSVQRETPEESGITAPETGGDAVSPDPSRGQVEKGDIAIDGADADADVVAESIQLETPPESGIAAPDAGGDTASPDPSTDDAQQRDTAGTVAG